MPRSTVYLDAIEGGRVESGDGRGRRHRPGRRSQSSVLSNTNLQLEVLGREAVGGRTAEQHAHDSNCNSSRTVCRTRKTWSRSTTRSSRLNRSDRHASRNSRRRISCRNRRSTNCRTSSTYYENQPRGDAGEPGERRPPAGSSSSEAVTRFAGAQLLTSLAVRAQQPGRPEHAGATSPASCRASISRSVESIERGGRVGQIDDPDALQAERSTSTSSISAVSISPRQGSRDRTTAAIYEVAVIENLSGQVNEGQI